MPHLLLEYTTNLLPSFNPEAALRSVNAALADSGLFEADHIKSRATRLRHFRVGNSDRGEAYIHARLHLLSGRSNEEKRSLTESLVAALQPHIAAGPALRVQITAEALDLDRNCYAKAVVNP
jgi:5-carboxymethyl-2-hydroxymuconate isomerase